MERLTHLSNCPPVVSVRHPDTGKMVMAMACEFLTVNVNQTHTNALVAIFSSDIPMGLFCSMDRPTLSVFIKSLQDLKSKLAHPAKQDAPVTPDPEGE